MGFSHLNCPQFFMPHLSKHPFRVFLGMAILAVASAMHAQPTTLVTLGPDGKLVYTPTAKGDVVPDYSDVGYKNSEVDLPDPSTYPRIIPIFPEPGDRRAFIQQKIDELSLLPIDPATGLRGALYFNPGTYIIGDTLNIRASGIVLRGAGTGANGTLFQFTRKARTTCVRFAGSGGPSRDNTTAKPILGEYVPFGSRQLTLPAEHGFVAGDWVYVEFRYNQAWIDLMRMNVNYLIEGTTDESWDPAAPFPSSSGSQYRAERQIKAVNGDVITLDAPIMDPIPDRIYGEFNVMKFTDTRRIENVGIEHIRINSSYENEDDLEHGWRAVVFANVKHGWARYVDAYYFVYSTVTVENENTSFITVDNCKYIDPKGKYDTGQFYSFDNNGQRVLMQNCLAMNGGRHDFVSGSWTPGPSVFFNCEATGSRSDSGPHHRWTSGHLYDNVKSDYSIRIRNRGTAGSGHGWVGSQIMLWNCADTGGSEASVVQDPPGDYVNWAVGFTGAIGAGRDRIRGTDQFEVAGPILPGVPEIPSLFLAQLNERLGGGPLVNEAPIFNPAPGAYSAGQSVTISSPTIGSLVNYTTDGSEPSATNGTLVTGPVSVNSSTTLKAIAYSGLLPDSPVSTGSYTIINGGVTVTPAQGLYNISMPSMQPGLFVAQLEVAPSGTDSVVGFSLGEATSASSLAVAVRFNASGFVDAINGDNYAAASSIAYTPGSTYRLRFIINVPARTYSAYVMPIGSSERTIGLNYAFQTSQASVGALNTVGVLTNGGPIFVGPLSLSLRPTLAPIPSPLGGTYMSVQSVTLSSRTPGAFIRYTTDGSIPTTTSGTVYSGPITISRNTTLRAIAYAAGATSSSMTTANYTIVLPAAAPTFSPPGGSFSAALSVSLSSTTPGATFRYTTDGSNPTATTGLLYSGPIAVSSTTTIKAITLASGFSESPVATAAYVFGSGPQDFVNLPLSAAQSDVFSLELDATPSGANTRVGLALGTQTADTGMAALVNFSVSGLIEARNGDLLSAASAIPYSIGTKYRLRFVVDLTTRTYSAYVTPEGGSTQLIGKYYAFGSAPSAITSLDTLCVATSNGPADINAVSLTATTEPAAWSVSGPSVFTGTNSVTGPITAGSAPSLTVSFFSTATALANMGPVDKIPTTGTNGWSMKLRSNGQLWFRIGSEASGSRTDVIASNVYTAGNRVHIACTFTGGTAVIYVNGVAVQTRTGIAQGVANTATALRLGIPSVAATSNVYIGTLDRVKIYNTALDATQIRLLAD
jgi:hypothetical protein